jgi:hypothetical protein
MPEPTPPYLLPEDCVDQNLLKEAVFQCLGESSYYHDYFRWVFLAAGFVVRRVEREPSQPVWKIKLLPGTFALSRDETEAARQIRRLLKANSFSVDRDAIGVTLNGNYITCSFVCKFGWEKDSNDAAE